MSPTHEGYVRVWINRDGNWEAINEITKISPENNKIIVKAKNIVQKTFQVRVRYSLIKSDLNSPTSPAISGEIEEYTIYGDEILKVAFNGYEELGISINGKNMVLEMEDILLRKILDIRLL